MNAIVPITDAKLPASYEHAREALERCERIDECKEWSDKAAALASYAKQADDEPIEVLTQRTLAEKLELLWRARRFDPGERRPELLSKLDLLETETRDAA